MPSNGNGWSPSNIKPGGWIIIILIIALIGYFGMKHLKPGPGVQTANGTSDTSGNGGAQQPSNGDVLVSTSGTKLEWLQEEAQKFNSQGQGHVTLMPPTESRDAMQGILNGKLHPTIWSPSSPVWTERLAQLKSGILDESDPASYRVIFKSPLVFLTTRDKAEALRPVLTGSTPFTTLAKQGRYKFGYADPLNASSGMLTMALIINEYCRLHGGIDPTRAAESPGFVSFLGQLNRGLVKSDNEGSSKLEKAYEADPTSRDFITAYESAALTAVAQNPNLTIIYPNPTANADQGAAVIDADWVTPDQKATAQKFLQFIGGKEAQRDGVRYSFRPAINGAQTLGDNLNDAQKSCFQASYTSVELPPYDALNEGAAQYRTLLK